MPNKIVQLIDNEDNNIYPVAGSLAQGSVTTSTINDAAVTAAKIDFGTMPGNYSASEIDTGYTWIDGKHIYKKTISLGALPNATTNSVSHGISNLGYVIKTEGAALSTNGVRIDLPFSSSSGASNVQISVESSDIKIDCATDRSDYTISYITLYYTKSS